jgi:flagellar basal body-associated protein FliL
VVDVGQHVERGAAVSQDWSLTPSAPIPIKTKGKGAIITGLVLLVVGIVVAVVGIVALVSSASNLVTEFGDTYDTPNTITRSLTAGTTYLVYEQTTGTTSRPGPTSVTPSDVTVTGPDGASVPVRAPGTQFSQSFDGGPGEHYVGVAQFDPPTTGTYDIAVATEGATVTVAPSFTAIGKALSWIALIVLGALLGLAGLITLIVGLVRRSSSRKPQVAYAAPPAGAAYSPPPVAPVAQAAPPLAPPAGWYPDPGRPGGQRYWDGSAWTDHLA